MPSTAQVAILALVASASGALAYRPSYLAARSALPDPYAYAAADVENDAVAAFLARSALPDAEPEFDEDEFGSLLAREADPDAFYLDHWHALLAREAAPAPLHGVVWKDPNYRPPPTSPPARPLPNLPGTTVKSTPKLSPGALPNGEPKDPTRHLKTQSRTGSLAKTAPGGATWFRR